jgi:Ca2+-binding EF-hand superfamily protein
VALWYHRYFQNSWPDGNLDLYAFKDFFRGLFPEKAENIAEHYFRTIDKDKTGIINFREFLLFLSAEGTVRILDRIAWLFDLFDVDGNGSIDRKEMVEIFKVSVTIRYLYIWGLLDGDDGVTLSVRKLKKKTAYIIKYIYIYILLLNSVLVFYNYYQLNPLTCR